MCATKIDKSKNGLGQGYLLIIFWLLAILLHLVLTISMKCFSKLKLKHDYFVRVRHNSLNK